MGFEPEIMDRIPNKRCFFRCLAVHIDLAGYQKHVVGRSNGMDVIDYSEDVKNEFREFIHQSVKDYNATHTDSVTELETIESIAAIFDREILEECRERLIPQ